MNLNSIEKFLAVHILPVIRILLRLLRVLQKTQFFGFTLHNCPFYTCSFANLADPSASSWLNENLLYIKKYIQIGYKKCTEGIKKKCMA